jgi:hypothetical protein
VVSPGQIFYVIIFVEIKFVLVFLYYCLCCCIVLLSLLFSVLLVYFWLKIGKPILISKFSIKSIFDLKKIQFLISLISEKSIFCIKTERKYEKKQILIKLLEKKDLCLN